MFEWGLLKRLIVITSCSIVVLGVSRDRVVAEQLHVGFGQEKPPFVIGKSLTGLEVDIFREALAFKGHKMIVGHMPNKRLQIALTTMEEVDAVATVRQIPGDGLYYVDDFMYFDNYAITKKRDQLRINKISDLVGHSIVAWQNAYRDLGSEFEELFKPDPPKPYKSLYREAHSRKNQNGMFWLWRTEVIVIDKTIFAWYRKQLSKGFDTTPEVTFHPIFSGKTYFQAAFKNQNLARDFEAGLKHIKNTGLYDQLYQKYTN